MSEPLRRARSWPSLASHAAAAVLGGVAVSLVLWLAWPGERRTADAAAKLDVIRAAPEAFSWSELPEASFPIPPYARFLEGVRIVLDPGHVGQRDKGGDWKRGPTGLREAEVNLRVAQFLREFLESVGAEVILTRSEDRSLDLEDAEDLFQRAEIANSVRADLLLSIHHNGGPPDANYTTLFYHAGPDHSPASLSAARYLLTGLNDALRLERHVECAVLADYTIYRGQGFAVLRHARVPAVLSEASFHSNPQEESRLRDPLYNRREAYGLFLGLARWAQAGLPRVRLTEPGDGVFKPGRPLVVQLDDGLSGRGGFGASAPKILKRSLVLQLDGSQVPFEVDWAKGVLTVRPPRSVREARELYVDFSTIFGQHVLHPRIELKPAGGR